MLDIGSQRLWRGNRAQILDPKAVGVLVHLAQAAPHFVSRDELLARTWAGSVVGDNVLHQVIRRLRKYLGDSAHSSAVIETLSKRGYRLRGRPGEIDSFAPGNFDVSTRALSDVTLVVLPFEDVSNGASDPYLADGLTLEIGSQLAKVASIRVMSRSAVRACLSDKVERDAVASRLGAGRVLDGVVRSDRGRVRITVQLNDVTTRRQLWSGTFDRVIDDLFALQSEVAISIVRALEVRIGQTERAAIERGDTQSLVAYRLVQRAERFTAPVANQNSMGIALLEEACTVDPHFARALADLSWRHSWNAIIGVEGAGAMARSYAEQALVTEPQSAAAHFSMAKVLTIEGHPLAAIDELHCAVALEPSHLFALQDLGWLLAMAGQLDHALEVSLRALHIEPNNANTRWHVAIPLLMLADYDRARTWLVRVRQELPNDSGRHRCTTTLMLLDLLTADHPAALARARDVLEHGPANSTAESALAALEVLLAVGQWDEACAGLDTWMKRAPAAFSSHSLAMRSVRTNLAFTLWQTGSKLRARAMFAETASSNRRRIDAGQESARQPLELASISAVLGDADEALLWLQQAYSCGYRQYDYLAIDPMLAPLRDDERFVQILSRMRLEVTPMRAKVQRAGLLAQIEACGTAGAD